jgi:hypothetical protein
VCSSLSLSSLSLSVCVCVRRICGNREVGNKEQQGQFGGLELGIRIPQSFCSEMFFLEKIGDSCSKERKK